MTQRNASLCSETAGEQHNQREKHIGSHSWPRPRRLFECELSAVSSANLLVVEYSTERMTRAFRAPLIVACFPS